MNIKAEEVSSGILNKMLFLKFAALSALVLGLTLTHPAATMAHKGAQKICSLLMQHNYDCQRHC
ncbi:hypothetical protein [Geobacter pickeringii]|uniref:Uncharacterized protein n=1 Tax=Geobacter pickeringii TaxID=345632 RepID=A0A0B5BEC8_9BACT|nr:hypothetical protein [Geobacter pickeringii]AJE03509.1 hypothetical protein GPICK_09245 [Geobacter pickeringii]